MQCLVRAHQRLTISEATVGRQISVVPCWASNLRFVHKTFVIVVLPLAVDNRAEGAPFICNLC